MPPRRDADRATGNPLNQLGVVVGLAAEARIARRLGVPVAIGGGTPEGARTAALSLISTGASALLSFGLAGGLDPRLRPGDIVIPASVKTLPLPSRGAADPTVLNLTPNIGCLLSTASPIITAEDKQTLYSQTGCAAVDLESGAVAEIAHQHSLPFAVLRAICDPADRSLPPAALVALDTQGLIGIRRIALSLARNPSQLPALLVLARDAARAHRALIAAVTRVQPPGYSPGTDKSIGSPS